MNVKWFLSSYTLDRQPPSGSPRLDEAVKEAGLEVAIDDIPRAWWGGNFNDFGDYCGGRVCVVMHGTKQFLTKNLRDWGTYLTPGAYAQNPKFSYSGFSTYYGKHMLNSEFILVPYAEILRRGPKAFHYNSEIFIRPDSTSKIFTGQVLNEDNFAFETNALNQISGVMPDTLCVVSPATTIDSEFRFVIVDGKVITGSEYRWDNILDVRSDVLPAAQEMAEVIAKEEWQPDRVYVCDIAMHNDKAYLLELNPFSSSGLYACDTRKIVDAVSKAAWLEFTGEDI